MNNSAKKLGRKIPLRSDWEDCKVFYMRELALSFRIGYQSFPYGRESEGAGRGKRMKNAGLL